MPQSQDHYAVLGLQALRYRATDEQIKKARKLRLISGKYERVLISELLADRRKVLRHHPDKKASGGGDANDDSFFKCIAKGSRF